MTATETAGVEAETTAAETLSDTPPRIWWRIGGRWHRPWRRLATVMCRYAWLVVGIWVVLAGSLNLAITPLEKVVAARSGPFIPDDAPSLVALAHMGSVFGESSASAIGYLVFEDPRGLSDADRQFADQLLATITARHAAIDSVQNLPADPATAPIANSADGQAMYAAVRFRGGMGSASARAGQAFLTDTLAHTKTPAGLQVYLTGPAPAIGDELATEDHTVLLITAVSVVMIVVLLLLVYRSAITIIVPLAAVGLALAVARPVVALLGAHAGLDLSIFSVMLLAALILGGGTDYAIFLLNAYHDARRRDLASDDAVHDAMDRTASVIVASGLTVAASCAVMAFTKVVLFRTTGLPCSLGMLIAVAASLTLVPALMSLLGRRGRLEPRARATSTRWERIGQLVTRRPALTLLCSTAVLILLALQIPRMSTSYDERAMQPATTTSNRGYDAVARHFPSAELTPDYVIIDADHDLRTTADLSALNAASRAAAAVPGVALVRSLTQPRGTPVPEFTLAGQNSILAQKLGDAVAALQASQPQLDRLTNGAARLDDGLHALSTGARAITSGSGRIASGGGELRDGLATASTSSTRLADGADRLADGSKQLADGVDTAAKPLFALLNSISPPGPCPDGHCDPSGLAVLAADNSTLGQIRYQLTRLYTGARQLADGNTRLAAGIGQLRSGLRDAARGSTTLAAGQNLLTDKLTELTHGAQDAHAGTQQLAAGVRQIRPQMQQLLDGLRQAHDILAASGTATGPDAGFFVPQSAFTDPRYTPALRYFLSADGHSARLMVVDRDSAYSPGAPDRVGALTMAVRTALAGTSLQHAHISATGLAAGFADLHTLVLRDFALIAACALICIAVILAVLLRALLAPLYMLITIALSYAAALGLTVLIWQDLFGIDIYWAVPPLAFIALVAVGSDYNIMVMSRIREESTDDFRTGIVRAVSSTGGVVSTAGVIFALTMLAMLASPTHSIGQVGSTIGCGLLLDTFLVRAFTVPAIAALFGHANWWPARRARQTPAPSAQPTTEHTTPIEAI